jgi:hypothetical protein
MRVVHFDREALVTVAPNEHVVPTRCVGLVRLPTLVEGHATADGSAAHDDCLVFGLQRSQPGAFAAYEDRVFEMLAELRRPRAAP